MAGKPQAAGHSNQRARSSSLPEGHPFGSLLSVSARALALSLGCFALHSELRALLGAGLNANIWWVDLRALPLAFAAGLRLLAAACLLGYALRPSMGLWRRRLTILVLGVLAAFTLGNCVQFYALSLIHI